MARRNPLRRDPTRTVGLRGRFIRDLNRRFRALAAAHRQLIVELDVFGLRQRGNPLRLNVEREAWRFLTDEAKITQYKQWLEGEISTGILTTGADGAPWTNAYINSAYRTGVVRAYNDSRAALGEIGEPGFFAGGRSEFLRAAFAAPETESKLRLLYTRAFDSLKGMTTQMGNQLSRVLTTGLAAGLGPEQIARNITNQIARINRNRARTIARTELIHAHAEGQLDSFERLGVEEVGVLAEWITAGDDRVCPQCFELEGAVMPIPEARGLIPRHPNCRCAWVPATEEKVNRARLKGQISKSISKERPKASARDARALSEWIGKELL